MKKLFLTAAIAVMTLATNQAQELKFGVKAGLNIANIGGDLGNFDFDETNDFEARTSFHVGGLVEIPISEKFAIQPEVLYSSQGAKSTYRYDDGFDFENSESTIKLDYITLPIMAKFMPFEGFSIEAGPQVGFLVSAKSDNEFSYTDSGTGETVSGSEDGVDVKDLYKSIDFGLNFGVGYRLENGIMFQARYNFGLADIDEEDDSDDFEEFDDFFEPKNRVFQLSVGYMF